MAASGFPETPVTIYCTTWSYNPKDNKIIIKFVTVGVRNETPAFGCGF
jgi:hypothetical protein